jgi:hypothetical protein
LYIAAYIESLSQTFIFVLLVTMPAQLSIPLTSSYDSLSSDPASPSVYDSSPSIPKFPHTRAQLSLIARQHKPLDSVEGDVDGDDFSRVSPMLVSRVVALLVEEQEDELKAFLKKTYDMDNDTV